MEKEPKLEEIRITKRIKLSQKQETILSIIFVHIKITN